MRKQQRPRVLLQRPNFLHEDLRISVLRTRSHCQTPFFSSLLEPRTQSYIGDLVSQLNWFNTTLKGQADALISFDKEFLGGHSEAELVASLQRRNTGAFEFGPVVAVPEQHSIKVGVEAPFRFISPAHSGLGVSVSLPEWTASAAAWVLAMVMDAARGSAPDVRNFAVRVTRVR